MTSDRLPILERVFRSQCSSLAQYLGESWPWTDRNDREAEELVRSIMADERRWASQLAELIDQRGGVPRPGSYPTTFTSVHFLALDFMLRRLAEYLEQDVASLARKLDSAADDPPLRSLLEQMIERKRGQIDALRKLVAAITPAKTAGAV